MGVVFDRSQVAFGIPIAAESVPLAAEKILLARFAALLVVTDRLSVALPIAVFFDHDQMIGRIIDSPRPMAHRFAAPNAANRFNFPPRAATRPKWISNFALDLEWPLIPIPCANRGQRHQGEQRRQAKLQAQSRR
jgi:hypothetical protein